MQSAVKSLCVCGVCVWYGAGETYAPPCHYHGNVSQMKMYFYSCTGPANEWRHVWSNKNIDNNIIYMNIYAHRYYFLSRMPLCQSAMLASDHKRIDCVQLCLDEPMLNVNAKIFIFLLSYCEPRWMIKRWKCIIWCRLALPGATIHMEEYIVE